MLGNYKIRVNNEAESREAQELFFELGYRIGACTMEGFPYLIVTQKDYSSKCGDLNSFKRHKELTLSQLKDMVVLHRNNVNDATHEFASGSKAYVSSDDVCYEYSDSNWVMFTTGSNGIAMKPIKPTEQGLISGADALRALADGGDVDANHVDFGYWFDARNLNVTDFFDDVHTFRLKPSNIKIEIEIPKTFKPKVGDCFYVICPTSSTGYTKVFADNEENLECFTKLGAWRSSEEIKQFVEALRSGIKGVDNV